MEDNFTRLVASSGFKFKPGFSGRVMDALKQSVQTGDPAVSLAEQIRKLFIWINAPVVAALMVLALIFFLNASRANRHGANEAQVSLGEAVYEYYISNN